MFIAGDEDPIYRLGADWRLHPARRTLVRHGGEPVQLPSRAFDVLTLLVEERHRTISKEEISERVWAGVSVTQNNLNQCVTALRKVFGDSRQNSQFIATIPNAGYRFVAAVALIEPSPEAALDSLTPSDSSPEPRRRSGWRAARIGGFGLLAVALLLVLAWRWNREPRWFVVAMPFVNLQQDDQLDWLAGSLAEFTAGSVTAAASARETGAKYVFTGAYRLPAKDTISIRVTLREGASGNVVGREVEASGPLSRFAEIALDLRRKFEPYTGKVDGSESYTRGLGLWRRGDLAGSVHELRMAIEGGALPVSSLGAVLAEMGHTAESRVLHQRAMELAAANAASPLDAWQTALIEARHRSVEGDWERAIEGLTGAWTRQPDQLNAALELAGAQFGAGNTRAATATLETAAKLIERAEGDARWLLLRARIRGRDAEMEGARKGASAAAVAARERGLIQLEGRALLLESGASQNLGMMEAAHRLREQAKVLCGKVGDRVCLSAVWRVEGNARLGSEQVREAAKCYWKALELARATGNAPERIHILNGLGAALIQDGRFQQAEVAYRDGLKLDLERLGLARGGLQNGLAEALLGQKRFREAEVVSAEALQLSEAVGEKEVAAKASVYLARAREGAGDATAAASYEKSIRLFEEVGNPEFTKEALILYARFLVGRANNDRAEGLLRKAGGLSTSLHQARLNAALAELRQAKTR